MNEKIKIIVIYEILGRPAEHIKISLEQLIDLIGENPGIKIVQRKVHEPHLIDKEKAKHLPLEEELYSTFAEVDIELDNLLLLFALVMNTLPSNIEVVEPEEFRLKNFDLSSLVSDLTIKLHKYDEITKTLMLEKNQFIHLIEEMDKEIKRLGGTSPVGFTTEKKKETATEKIEKNEVSSEKAGKADKGTKKGKKK